MASLRGIAYGFDRGAYYSKHTARGGNNRQVVLLDTAQRLCRCCVAGKYNQVTPLCKKVLHTLAGKFIDHIERARAVGCARIIAKIQVVVLRQQFLYFTINCEPAIARIEDSYGAGCLCLVAHCILLQFRPILNFRVPFQLPHRPLESLL